ASGGFSLRLAFGRMLLFGSLRFAGVRGTSSSVGSSALATLFLGSLMAFSILSQKAMVRPPMSSSRPPSTPRPTSMPPLPRGRRRHRGRRRRNGRRGRRPGLEDGPTTLATDSLGDPVGGEPQHGLATRARCLHHWLRHGRDTSNSLSVTLRAKRLSASLLA